MAGLMIFLAGVIIASRQIKPVYALVISIIFIILGILLGALPYFHIQGL